MYIVHLQSRNQSFHKAFELAAIKLFTNEVVRLEVVTVNAFVHDCTVVSGAFGGLPHWLLNQFSAICTPHWQRKHFCWSFSVVLTWLCFLSLFALLLSSHRSLPIQPCFVRNISSESDLFCLLIAVWLSTSRVKIWSDVAVIAAVMRIMRARMTVYLSFHEITQKRYKMCSWSLILAIVSARCLSAAFVSLVYGPAQRVYSLRFQSICNM